MAKPTRWVLTNPVIVPNAKATGKETFLALHADTIVKNGKATTGTVINLTREQTGPATGGKDETFNLTQNAAGTTATLIRTEGRRGRKQRVGMSASDLQAFLNPAS